MPEEEVIFVNFPGASENDSGRWAWVDPPERASRYTSSQPRKIPERPEKEVVHQIA